ncbi:MAG: hypothetical protein H6825_03680 [Planctomycetes bacterium]|nr:hypothetical protein [Planctomycetota bacterium]
MNGEAINGLTAVAAVALLLLAVMTSVLRGQANAQGYALAELQDEADDCVRRLRTLEMECARAFAAYRETLDEPGGGDERSVLALHGARP